MVRHTYLLPLCAEKKAETPNCISEENFTISHCSVASPWSSPESLGSLHLCWTSLLRAGLNRSCSHRLTSFFLSHMLL